MSQYADGVLSPAQMTPLVIDFVRSVGRHDETLEGMKTQIGSMAIRMAGFQTELDSMNDHLGDMNRRMSKIEEGQRRIDLNVAELRLDMSAGFEGIQTRLATLETKHDEFATATKARFDDVDAKFAAVDARFDDVDAKFAAVDARLRTMDAKFEARFVAVDARFDDIDAKFVKVDERFTRIEGRLTSIEGQLAAIARAVNAELPPEAESAGLGC